MECRPTKWRRGDAGIGKLLPLDITLSYCASSGDRHDVRRTGSTLPFKHWLEANSFLKMNKLMKSQSCEEKQGDVETKDGGVGVG